MGTSRNTSITSGLSNSCFHVMLLLSLPTCHTLAQSCAQKLEASAPAERFQLNPDATAIDRKTGLMWARCAIGQQWLGNHCSIPFDTFNYDDVEYTANRINKTTGLSGYHDWRVPTLLELETIVEHQCFDPAIDLRVFPETPITGFWSATLDESYDQGAWLIHFYSGGQYMGNKAVDWALRLVRDTR